MRRAWSKAGPQGPGGFAESFPVRTRTVQACARQACRCTAGMGEPQAEDREAADLAEAASIRCEVKVERRLLGGRRSVRFAVGRLHGKGWRLDKYLHAILPTISRGLLRKWIDQGHCTVDGGPTTIRAKLKPGQVVHLDAPVRAGTEAPSAALALLGQGRGWCVVNKPAGQLPHPAGRILSGTVLDQVQDWFSDQGGDPAEVRLVNRIDRDTSGIVLVSLDLGAHTLLAEALEAHALRKEYRAICHGTPRPAQGSWTDPILEASVESIAMRIDPAGKPSHTDYEVLEVAPQGYSLLRVLLRTGRQHQIRIHAAHHGHPLVGDWVYGPACADLAGQALHAAILAFPDPERPVRTITIEAPLPGSIGTLWDRLVAGGTVTPRELNDDERSRLGRTASDHRLPDWLSQEQRETIQRELDDHS